MRTRIAFVSLATGLACLAGAPAAHAIDASKASDLVTLVADAATPVCPGTTDPHAFTDRLMPNGTRAPFSIPAGQVLVMTSYDWVVEGSSEASRVVWTGVVMAPAATPGGVYAFFSGDQADAGGRASGSITVPQGVVVRPGTTLCHSYVGGAGSTHGRVHGFLAPDR